MIANASFPSARDPMKLRTVLLLAVAILASGTALLLLVAGAIARQDAKAATPPPTMSPPVSYCKDITYHVVTTPTTKWCLAYIACGNATTMTWVPPEVCGLPETGAGAGS